MHTDHSNTDPSGRIADQIGLPLPLIERLPIGVAVTDAEGRFLILTRRSVELLGLPEVVRSVEELQAGPPVYLLDGKAPATLEERPLARVLAGEGPVSGILRVKLDGAERRIFAECFPLFDDAGELAGAAATYSPMDRAASVAPAGELHTISRDLAHELNQPLTTISLYSRGCIRRLRNDGSEDEEMLEALEAIHAQSLHAGDIIRHAREVSPWGALQLESRNLNSLLLEMKESAEDRAAEAGCALEVELDPDLPACLVDSERIRHLLWRFTDLGLQAVRAAESDRILRWSTSKERDMVEVRISETVSGSLGLDHAPFDESKAQRALSLTICRRIADEHGGRIDLDRDPVGSRVRLILPVSSEVQEHDERDE